MNSAAGLRAALISGQNQHDYPAWLQCSLLMTAIYQAIPWWARWDLNASVSQCFQTSLITWYQCQFPGRQSDLVGTACLIISAEWPFQKKKEKNKGCIQSHGNPSNLGINVQRAFSHGEGVNGFRLFVVIWISDWHHKYSNSESGWMQPLLTFVWPSWKL